EGAHNAPTRPESNMLDWLTWPADQLLRIGGVVAGWFFSRDATSFTVVQMMFATLVLAAFVTLIVFWQTLVEYWRSFWKPRWSIVRGEVSWGAVAPLLGWRHPKRTSLACLHFPIDRE